MADQAGSNIATLNSFMLWLYSYKQLSGAYLNTSVTFNFQEYQISKFKKIPKFHFGK